MHPEAKDIAVPPFPPGVEWLGEEPAAVERLCARGPVLVHFICIGDLGSVRTLPYVRAWHERYAADGLSVLAINTPRFPYTGERDVLEAGLARLEVDFPVALDSSHAIWHAYGCQGWPSLFLWSTAGALHWYQFGQGDYAGTEREIQALLGGSAAPLVAPVRPSDAEGALVMPPTPEVFPGGAPDVPWTAVSEGEQLTVEYEAGGASVSVAGNGELLVSVDRGAEAAVAVNAPGVHELTNHERHEAHTLTLRPERGLSLYSLCFAPGVP
jgi:hypothetical protein